jgi:hypothetical protein
MVDWFSTLSTKRVLTDEAASRLDQDGFVVIPDVVSCERMGNLTSEYDAAEMSATAPDKRVGSTSTRVSDYVNRGAAFDSIYLLPPLLDACCRVIGRPFKLSSFQSRTVHSHAIDQGLHVDVQRDTGDWPLLGFILMIDAFGPDNGATRLVPRSHQWTQDVVDRDEAILACGSPGSILIYSGSIWHGHSANTTAFPRRSLQGAFIPREGRAGVDFAGRMDKATGERLSSLAKYLVGL